MTTKKATKATAKKLVRELCGHLVPGSVEIQGGCIVLWLESAEGESNRRDELEQLADKLAGLLGKGWRGNGSHWRIRYAGESRPLGDGGPSDPMHY